MSAAYPSLINAPVCQTTKWQPSNWKKWRTKYPERNRALKLVSNARYRERHRAVLREKSLEYKAKNKDKRYTWRNRDRTSWRLRHRMWEAARRARKISVGGLVTVAEWQDILLKHDHRCVSCGKSDVPMTQDHIIPLSKGGPHVASNLQPLCKPCNCRKGARVA